MNIAIDPVRPAAATVTAAPARAVKCVVWDLDHTLWDGVLSEGDDVRLRPGVVETLRALDARGILHSIASKNTHEDAMRKLEELGVADYFLYPQIAWSAKSTGIGQLQKSLNIGIDTLLFVDDQPFERDEVAAAHPQVECIAHDQVDRLLAHPRLASAAATPEAARRRLMYLEDMRRQRAEETYTGTPESFLATLGMRFTIARAEENDLLRAEELTLRTNQLNSTGITYDIEDLRGFMCSPRHSLLVCELTDRYGSYGKIGLALVEHQPDCDHIRLLLMSCRIVSRGVGSVLLSHLMQQARQARRCLRADFRRTERNRQMLVTYQFAGFREVKRRGDGTILFQHDLAEIQDFPPYIEVRVQP